MVKKQEILFYKMQSSGNDCIIIDNRILQLPTEHMGKFAKRVCQRAFGIGADNLLFLDHATNNDDYRWHLYNSDGSHPEMCGNGANCIAWLAVHLGLAKKEHQFQTEVGSIQAIVYPDQNKTKILLTSPKDLRTNLTCQTESSHLLHFINTGIPHAIILTDSIAAIDVNTIGRAIRFHSLFAPEGTNVNFVQVIDPQHLLIRTYERGIEGEVHACGTGSAAVAFITNTLGLTKNDVELTTSGKEKLRVISEQNQLWLEGKVRLVYTGTLNLNALDLDLSCTGGS